MEKQSLKKTKHKHLTVLEAKPATTDWSIPYPGVQESGRGAFEHEGDITGVVVRYYSYQRMRFEKLRHFAEVIINAKEKFIIDGIERDPLIQHITDIAWTIIECRKKLGQANTNLKRIK